MIPSFDISIIKKRLTKTLRNQAQRPNIYVKPVPFKSTIISQQETKEPEGDVELENLLNDTLDKLAKGVVLPVPLIMHSLQRLKRIGVMGMEEFTIPRKKGGMEAAELAMELLRSFRTDKAQFRNFDQGGEIYVPTLIIYAVTSERILKSKKDWYIALVAPYWGPFKSVPRDSLNYNKWLETQYLGISPWFITNLVRSRKLVEMVVQSFESDIKRILLEMYQSEELTDKQIAWKIISHLYNNETKKAWLRDVKKELGWTFGYGESE